LQFLCDLSKITATGVFIYVFSSVSYLELNKELVPYWTLTFFKKKMQILYAIILMIDPCNSYAGISEITGTAVSFGLFSSVPYSELNKE
jgi:hypothetical protein